MYFILFQLFYLKEEEMYYVLYIFQGCFKDVKEVFDLKMGMYWYIYKFYIIYGII